VSKRRKQRPSTDRNMSDLVQFAAEVRAARAVLGWSQRSAVTQRAVYCIEQIIVRPPIIVRPRTQTEERIIETLTLAALISAQECRLIEGHVSF
jgi:hypothetical protein